MSLSSLPRRCHRLAGLLFLPMSLLAACGSWSPIPDRSSLAIEPFGAMMEPAGNASMQTPSAFGPLDQPEVGLPEALNLADREFGYGGNLSYGDDFAGVELGFFSWHNANVSREGEMPFDFGRLQQGDDVQSTGEWLLYRLAVRFPVIAHSFELEGRTDLDVRLAAGLAIHHNEFRMKSKDTGSERQQRLKAKDDAGFPLATVRLEGELRPFKLRVDVSAMKGKFDDIDGTVLDTAISLHYRVQRGVSVWAGLWRYDLPARGSADGLTYELDLDLSGYMVGLRWEF